jgi:predicted ester cyclase
MTTPDSVMRAWFEEVWNQGSDAAIDRLMAADAVVHGLPGGEMRGPTAFRGLFQSFRDAIPDIRITVERTVTEGDLCTAHCHVTGSHSGGGLGFAATERGVAFDGMVIARIVNGQIAEGWNCFDFLTMYQQLGVVPAAPGA